MKNKAGKERRNQLQGNMWRGADRRVCDQVASSVRDSVGNRVWNQVPYQLRGQVWLQIHNHLQEQSR